MKMEGIDLTDAVMVKSSRLKSVVWNDFDRVKKGDLCVAICRHCTKKLSGSSTSGTSHLRNHLIRCRRRSDHGMALPYSASENKKEVTLALVNIDQEPKRDDEVLSVVNLRYDHELIKNESATIGNANLDQRRSRFDLARMIILHGYPLTMVEDYGFRVFLKNLQPMFEHVSFDRVESDCMEIYVKEKQKVFDVLDKLPGKVNLCVDVWSALEGAQYLCLTAYYIDESWELKRKILNFFLVDDSHTYETHSEVIMTCLMEWDIDRKLFSMTVDHSLPFDEEKIRDRLVQNRFLNCNGQLFDVRCAVNVLNLMVRDALEAFHEVIHKIRESVRYVKSSQTSHLKFSQMAVEAGVENQRCLCLDNRTQWNTTFDMLDIALENKAIFYLLKENDLNYVTCPSDLEWERLSAVTSYLKLFVEVTNVFTQSKYSTANIYFPEICDIHLRLIEWCKNPDDFISTLAVNMRKKFDEYWDKCNLTLAVAAMLDPRFKMKLIEYYYPRLYGDSASELIDDVFECIRNLHDEHSIVSPLAWQAGSSGVKDTEDRLMGFDKFLDETTQAHGSKSDLDKYLEEPLFPRTSDFNVLNWWKVHAPTYPILSMMARNILGIPMSKVATESTFNTGGNVLNHYWHSLRPSTVQAVMCSQDWIRNELES